MRRETETLINENPRLRGHVASGVVRYLDATSYSYDPTTVSPCPSHLRRAGQIRNHSRACTPMQHLAPRRNPERSNDSGLGSVFTFPENTARVESCLSSTGPPHLSPATAISFLVSMPSCSHRSLHHAGHADQLPLDDGSARRLCVPHGRPSRLA